MSNAVATDVRWTLDPAIFAQEALGITPDPWQRRVLNWTGRRLALMVTRQGGKSTITILVAKVLHNILYKDGVDVRAENRKKREVFLCPQPMLTNTFILIACHLLSV